MVSVLDSGSSSPGSSPGRGHCVVFLGKILTLILPPPRSKWVLENCQGNLTKILWVTCDGLASHPGE